MSSLPQLVATHAEQAAEKTALSKWRPGADLVATSYGQLSRKARRFADRLGELVAQRTILPMVVGKSADSIAAMLAAMAADRPFCFVNTKYRGPQIAAVLDASGAQLCLVDAPGLLALKGAEKEYPQIARTTWVVLGERELSGIYADALASLRHAATVISLDDEDCSEQLGLAAQPSLGADGAGACLFTSGSTGEPKGVLVSADDLRRRTEAEIAWFGLTSADVLLSILPFSFDVGLNQLMTALAVGGELVLLDSWLPADILRTAEHQRVTGISGVPAIWQDMINAGVRFDKRGRHASLRYLTISGGSLARPYLETLSEIASGVQIFKTYGQTEAFRTTSLRPEDYHRLDSVGRPFAGVRVYVVRDDGSRCPPGEIGEVVHSGLGIMMGYVTNTHDNAGQENKLRSNPFCGDDDPSPFAVFTGDMGYLDADGYLFLKGRRDNMVKVMGNRVYPEEVTNQIVRITGVREATVVAMSREGAQSVLVAFVVVTRGVDLSTDAVRRALKATLPAFMVPKEIVIVDDIPRGASGKPDRRRLVAAYARMGTEANT